MKAMLYNDKMENPVSILDEVKLVDMDSDNHAEAGQVRLFFKTSALNATRQMVELYRDRALTVKLEDGRSGTVLLGHSSLDQEGNAVGVLRLLGRLS